MKTNEMMNDYVKNHLLGDDSLTQFVNDFIKAIGIELDGRLVEIRSNWGTKIRATFEGVEEFICNQIMSNSFGCFDDFTEPFQIIETAQPAVEWGMFLDGTIVSNPRMLAEIEKGKKKAAETE